MLRNLFYGYPQTIQLWTGGMTEAIDKTTERPYAVPILSTSLFAHVAALSIVGSTEGAPAWSQKRSGGVARGRLSRKVHEALFESGITFVRFDLAVLLAKKTT